MHTALNTGTSALFRTVVQVLVLAGVFSLTACSADTPANPSFPLLMRDAKHALEAMKDDRKPLPRPVVVVGGIYDPGVAAPRLAGKLRRITVDETTIIHVSFMECWSFESCREKLLRTLEKRLPSESDAETVEVDVIGVSMGGLVARFAALRSDSKHRRLNIARLFTIASPHRGARLAELPTLDARAVDMRAGSTFMKQLDDDPRSYPIIPYARLGDLVVGAENAAPPDACSWWVACPMLSPAHLAAASDPRFVADIARRLRGEDPYTMEPPAPLPGH